MVFKLVRTDTEEPCKIQLPSGTHMIGRGKFLDCDDKKVSRNHGELQVTDDSVIIKALHQNPCFYIKKGTADPQILKLHETVHLSNGDKFGLLPKSYWYELLHCTSLDIDRNTSRLTIEEEIDSLQDQTRIQNGLDDVDETNEDAERSNLIQGNISPSLIQRDVSPSLNQRTESPILTSHDSSPSLIPPATNQSQTQEYPANSPDTENTEVLRSPGKRSHSPEQSDEVKKVKTEPVVKQEPQDAQPGCSGDAAASSSTDNNGQGGPTGSPVKPPPLGRERCMFGANCYRRNPAHKAQFSHPSDSDWGAGERGVCPWGRGCRRRDPRHWRDHDHPPGVQPPTDPPPVKRKKQRKKQRSDSDSDSPPSDLIVTGKRLRKAVPRQSWSGSESEEDPFDTDDEDEWQPTGESQTQDTQSQDLLD